MASSSSSTQERSVASSKLYDAFISHRGPDVKHTFAKQLYDLLTARGCRAFLDLEELEGGDSIRSVIDDAICSSVVQIAIFSKGYAESSFCLNELVLMLKQSDAVFIPVFYNVQPSELRHINIKSQYDAAFSEYLRKGRNLDKLEEWKKALETAGWRTGYEFSRHQEGLCEKIVSRVLQEMEKRRPLHVAKYPVGLAELVRDFETICPETAETVVIFGLGGVGKTTLARELFNRKRSNYTASCFLSDVRDSHAKGNLHFLQRKLSKDLFGENQEFCDTAEGLGHLKHRLERAKHLRFLIILDDIDHENQKDALLPIEMLSSHSQLIITTRDRSVLRDADIFLYEMKGMEKDHAKELFCQHAFHRCYPPTAYENLVESFVRYCGGLPLSLMVLGAHVYHRDELYWELELEKVEKIQPKEIMQRLRISFDGLDKGQKQIFMDIACIFNKKDFNLIDEAKTLWNAANWSAEHALQTLQDKCLVEVVSVGYLKRFDMHDHLRDLGRQLADELGSPRLWRSDILRSMEAKGFKRILEETKGRCFHQFKDSSLGRKITYFIADTDLLWLEMRNDTDLLGLEMRNAEGRDLRSIPSWIPLRKLHILKVWDVKELWSSFQQEAPLELRMLYITNCLQKPPYSMEMFNHLEELHIEDSMAMADTTSLVQSLKHLSNLRSLVWRDIFQWTLNERKGRDSINLDSSTCSCLGRLETIRLQGLHTISKLVISGEMCPELRSLVVTKLYYLTEIEFKQLQSLRTLVLDGCYRLENVSGLSSLTELRQLEVESCEGLKSLPSLADFRRLEKIRIVGCPELQSVEGVAELSGLKSLVIQMPDDGYASGLRMPSVKKTILTQKAMAEVSAELNANLFSEVIGDEAVSELESGYGPKIESSSSAITIYTLLVATEHTYFSFEDETFYLVKESEDSEDSDEDSEDSEDRLLITFLLNQHDSEDILHHMTLRKGFKAIVKVEEEGKALTVLQRIVDRLYRQRSIPSWIPLRKLHSLKVWDVKELWSSFQQEVNSTAQAPSQLKELCINSDVEAVDSIMEENELRKGFDSLRNTLEWLRWDGFPLRYLPSWLTFKTLRVLELHGANDLEELWVDKAHAPLQLRELIITGTWSASFERFPSSISDLNHLSKIALSGYVGKEFGIKCLPEEFCDLQSLEHLELQHCTLLSSLPARFGDLRNLRHLDMCSCKGLRILPDSFKQLTQLQYLDLSDCKKLALQIDILENITELKNLNLSGCHKLRQLPHQITDQACLRILRLEDTRLEDLPTNIGRLSKLELLTIGSPFLTRLPVSLGDLSSLKSLSIIDCIDLESLPENFGRLSLLEYLCIESSELRSLPEGFTELTNLKKMKISGCPLGELNFGSGSSSALCNLRVIEITETCVARISITKDCCPSLETLDISRNDCLEEIEILPTTSSDNFQDVKIVGLENMEAS